MTNRVSMPGRSQLMEVLVSKGYNLADASLCDNFNDLHLIIGIDNCFKFVPGKRIFDNVHSIESNLGTIISGTIPNNSEVNSQVASLKN